MVKTKSVHSKIEPQEDGLRILAARGRGRGLPSDRYDVWMANLGPSEQLRDAILGGKISWREYSRRYLEELRESDGIDRRNKQIKNHGQKFTLRLLQHLAGRQTVTLLCHCAEDEPHCHRHLLKALLEKKMTEGITPAPDRWSSAPAARRDARQRARRQSRARPPG